MRITRHYCTVDGRRVHYRRCGSGPALLMVHQSPRSSAEYEQLMRSWGAHFTCIAPDTPGFGQSEPLPDPDADIADFADALAALVGVLRLAPVAAYGFHSGGIILVAAMRRHPQLFRALAIGGYAIWTPQEMAHFGDAYLPPFHPQPFGEHLVWLWNRILEQSWFFPWFDTRDAARLSVAHDDPQRVHAVVMDMLDAGNAYRTGYGAVLAAPRDIPSADAQTPPVFISAYAGDPLLEHIDRLGELPSGWSAAKLASPAEHQAQSLAFLLRHAGGPQPALLEDAHRGFAPIEAAGFNGLIHWQQSGAASALLVHAPGRAAELITGEGIAVDLPGHGLSDGWSGQAPDDWAAWSAVVKATAQHFAVTGGQHESLPAGDAVRLFPNLDPDRHGSHLLAAWSIARASQCFAPWYTADAAHAVPLRPGALHPEALAQVHRALLRAPAARALHQARQDAGVA